VKASVVEGERRQSGEILGEFDIVSVEAARRAKERQSAD